MVQAGRFAKDIMQRGWQTTKNDGLPYEIVVGNGLLAYREGELGPEVCRRCSIGGMLR
jgi:hypothetical protein